MASVVTKELVVDVPVERFWEVVADYARYPEFVPGIKKCRVLQDGGGEKQVEY